MIHKDRTIDFLTSAEADAVYEVVLEHIPITPSRDEPLNDAIDRTREDLRQHIRQRLAGMRAAPVLDGAVGRIRLTSRKGQSPNGSPYSGDCFFTCTRVLDNERAVQALNGSMFGEPPTRINAKANGRCIAALDVKLQLAELQDKMDRRMEEARATLEQTKKEAEAELRKVKEQAARDLDQERERAQATLKCEKERAGKELASERADAAKRENIVLQQHTAKLDEARLNLACAETRLEDVVHMMTLEGEKHRVARLDLKAHRLLNADLEHQLSVAQQQLQQQQAQAAPQLQQQQLAQQQQAQASDDVEAEEADDSVSANGAQDDDDENGSEADSFVTSINILQP